MLDDRHNAVIAEKVKKEEAKRQVEAELQRKLKTLQAEYNRQVRAEKDTLDGFVSDWERQTAEKRRQVALRKEEMQQAQRDELHGKGVDTSALDAYPILTSISAISIWLAFIFIFPSFTLTWVSVLRFSSQRT